MVSASATISHPKASVVPQLSHFLSCPRRWLSPTSLIRMILPPYTHTSLRFSTTHSIQSHMIIYYPVFQVTEILLFSHSVVSDSLRPHGLQHSRPPCPSPTPRVYSNSSIELVMPSNHLILCCPLLLPPSIFPRIRVFSNESVFASGGQRDRKRVV